MGNICNKPNYAYFYGRYSFQAYEVKNLALLSGIIGALWVHASCSTDGIPAYKNPKLSPQKRTADLLSRMTVEEKTIKSPRIAVGASSEDIRLEEVIRIE